MKSCILLLLALSLAPAAVQADSEPNQPPPVAKSSAPATTGPAMPIEDYDGTVNGFRTQYQKAGKPKLLVYVNRSLVKNRGEMLDAVEVESDSKTKGDTIPGTGNSNVQIGNDNKNQTGNNNITGKGGEQIDSTSTKVRVNTERALGVAPVTEAQAREIEEVIQRPFFEAGSKIVDQKIAEVALTKFKDADANFLTPPKTDKEHQEVEALQKSADIVIEVLARQKTVVIPMPSGDDQKEVRLELTVTAVNLKDGVKLAQVNSNSLFGFNRRFGDRKERRYNQVTSAEIIEQCALALMQRMNF